MQIKGNILAPKRDSWGTCSKRWLHFIYVKEMTVDGSGVINGQGDAWWGNVRHLFVLELSINYYLQIHDYI